MWDKHSFKISALFRFGIDSVWKIFELKDYSVTQFMNHGGDCRTAPATPGLLIIQGGSLKPLTQEMGRLEEENIGTMFSVHEKLVRNITPRPDPWGLAMV